MTKVLKYTYFKKNEPRIIFYIYKTKKYCTCLLKKKPFYPGERDTQAFP